MKYLAIALVLMLCGCVDDGIQTASTDNPRIPVTLILEHDGCKVYRFNDGLYRYFTKCESTNNSRVEWSETCGKNCIRNAEIETGYSS